VSESGRFADRENINFKETIIDLDRLVFVKPDVALVSLKGVQFKDVVKYFPDEASHFEVAQGQIGKDRIIARHHGPLIVDNSGTALHTLDNIKYQWENHGKGACGMPVVLNRDSGCIIGGIHSAGSKNNSDGYAITVTRGELEDAMMKVEGWVSHSVAAESLYGGEPNVQSVLRYEDQGPIQYLGKVSDAQIHNVTGLKKSHIHDKLSMKFFEEFGYVRDEVYRPPLLQPVGKGVNYRSPWNNGFRKIAKWKTPINPRILSETVDQIVERIIENLGDVPKLQPVDVRTAINGTVEDAFFRRIDMNKAAGFGTPGTKKDHAHKYEDEECLYYEPKENVMEQIKYMLNEYREGRSCGPVFKAQLKDELRTLKKVLSGNTRIYYASPFAYLILQRMFLSPLYTLMVEKSDCFYTALGTDMHKEGHRIKEMHRRFSRLNAEGDYGGFDTSMPYEIGEAACLIIIRLLKHYGYSREQLWIALGILTDGLFPLVDFLGDLLKVPGLQPSGKFATAEDNSLRNLVILVYIWNTIQDERKEGLNFFDHCLPTVYGDDFIIAVKEEVGGWFHQGTLARGAEEMGLSLTSSSKGEVTTDFTEDMSFLKRTFRYHPDLGREVATLDLASIYKTLEWTKHSNENKLVQIRGVYESTLREIFFWSDRGCYNTWRKFLSTEYVDEFGAEVKLPSYDELVENYR
jgi:hypothetical protein